MALRAVFLDLGNTLVNERRSRAEVYAERGRAHGIDVDPARMAELMHEARKILPVQGDSEGYRYSDAWFRAFQRHVFLERLGMEPRGFEALSRDLFDRFQEAATFQVMPGSREMLADLRQRGVHLGLISNWSERLPVLLRALELDRCFDLVLGSAHERLEKPARGLFERALERLGIAPEEALHAGDDLVCDVQGAMAAGLSAVLVDHAARREGPFPFPVVRSLTELHDLVIGRLA